MSSGLLSTTPNTDLGARCAVQVNKESLLVHTAAGTGLWDDADAAIASAGEYSSIPCVGTLQSAVYSFMCRW